jgi:hypothetical protein
VAARKAKLMMRPDPVCSPNYATMETVLPVSRRPALVGREPLPWRIGRFPALSTDNYGRQL